MDFATILASLISSGIISFGLVRWLGQRFVDHRLAKDLKEFQQRLDSELAGTRSGLEKELTAIKANMDATLRREVEEYLGDRSADRQYQLEARKRLYTAIGPLKFQLITATRDFANRVDRIGRGTQPFAINLDGYFGRSTVFRLLRLLGIVELIERQMAYADFAAEPSTVALLRFKHKAFLCLSSGSVVLGHPNANWNEQHEHVFFDALSVIASATIVHDATGQQRVMRFDEFNTFVEDPRNIELIHPVPRLMDGFSMSAKPILWLRLVALAGLSAQFLQREGPAAGVMPEPLNVEALVQATQDEFIAMNRDQYVKAIRRLIGDDQPIGRSGGSANTQPEPTPSARSPVPASAPHLKRT